jgi:S1-C subfamily serine protease
VKKIIYILIALLINIPLTAEIGINKSIVKIYTVKNNYNYDNPWQMGSQSNGTGSGCIIDGNRILTNAHVISNNTFLQVKKAGEAKKYTARVDSISHESDLAILKVDDQSFFKNSQAIKIGELPLVRDKVAVYGFPTGGDEMSITEGVVSRIENRNYAHSSANLLTCQIDAAINPGNSGGPVIINNKIVGVAFQSATRGENIGYMVPAPIINHFLTDISNGEYNGFPELGILFQKMENPDIREKYQMKQNHSGILIIGILHESPAKNIINIDDVVLSIDGSEIENDGSVEFRPGERTSLNYIVQKKFINDSIAVKVLRNGEARELKVKLTVPMNSARLVPFEQYETAPTYYIAGGIIFAPLTKNYLFEWGNQWFFSAPTKLLDLYQNGVRSADRRDVVLITKVLADEINLGYHDIDNIVIVKVNDKKISSIEDVVDAIENNKGIYHTIEDDIGKKIILRKDQVDKFSARILQTYRIDSDRSDNLKSKPGK